MGSNDPLSKRNTMPFDLDDLDRVTARPYTDGQIQKIQETHFKAGHSIGFDEGVLAERAYVANAGKVKRRVVISCKLLWSLTIFATIFVCACGLWVSLQEIQCR